MAQLKDQFLGAQRSATLESVQAGILLLCNPRFDQTSLDGLFELTVQQAKQLGLHLLEPTDKWSSTDEMGARCWWYLAVRSWMRAPVTWSYSIHPSHFTTPKPSLHMPDLQSEAPGGWSPASFCLAMIELATVVRTGVDLRNASPTRTWSNADRQALTRLFATLALTLPPYYAVEGVSDRTQAATQHVERWLLHHYIFTAFLRLHRDELRPDSVSVSVSVLVAVLLRSCR